jgi:hypothetical protein
VFTSVCPQVGVHSPNCHPPGRGLSMDNTFFSILLKGEKNEAHRSCMVQFPWTPIPLLLENTCPSFTWRFFRPYSQSREPGQGSRPKMIKPLPPWAISCRTSEWSKGIWMECSGVLWNLLDMNLIGQEAETKTRKQENQKWKKAIF